MKISWRNFFNDNPYADFPLGQWPENVTGWNSDDKLFESLILELRPQIIVEVGTWRGQSALHMADIVNRNSIDCSIVCVDTFLGSIEFWTRRDDPERFGSLDLKNGYPQVYYQFMANVLHRGFSNTIIPFPVPSSLAARWFVLANEATPGFTADLIYIDASHEYEDVLDDLHNWWKVLRNGGVIFGDDYETFEGVRGAVEMFGHDVKIVPQTSGNKWWIRKL